MIVALEAGLAQPEVERVVSLIINGLDTVISAGQSRQVLCVTAPVSDPGQFAALSRRPGSTW